MRITNTYNQLKVAKDGVAICTNTGGIRLNDQHINGWKVVRFVDGSQVPTYEKAPWYDYGCKVFLSPLLQGTFHARQKQALEAAKEWIKEQGWYDGEWKRNSDGCYVPADIHKNFPIEKNKDR